MSEERAAEATVVHCQGESCEQMPVMAYFRTGSAGSVHYAATDPHALPPQCPRNLWCADHAIENIGWAGTLRTAPASDQGTSAAGRRG